MTHLLISLILAVSVTLPSSKPSCVVEPTAIEAGLAITVTVFNVTKKEAKYGWFAVYDVGPLTRQAATTLNPGPPYGDNGAYLLSWNGTTVKFRFYVQNDPGLHAVSATYRGVFAACSYTALP